MMETVLGKRGTGNLKAMPSSKSVQITSSMRCITSENFFNEQVQLYCMRV